MADYPSYYHADDEYHTEDFPNYYDPKRIGTLFYPDVGSIAAEAVAAGLPPVSGDSRHVELVIIDMQIDFCHDKGGLNVPGSIPDLRRLIEFIFRNAQFITHITCSLDSHLPHQIFSPHWWVGPDGKHPEPFTIITYQDIQDGKWRPVEQPAHSRSYVKALEQQAKKQLTIWPYHTLTGSIGHALDPELWSAIMWHSLARKSQPEWLIKGSVPETEHYSAVQPEIAVPDHPQGTPNEAFLTRLRDADLVIFAGEAESHCVLETVEDVVEAFGERRKQIEKMYVLQDCMSPVVHPEVDFHAIAMEQFKEFEAQGIKLINSTDDALPFLQWQEPIEAAKDGPPSTD